jgi:hypothetical protein
MKPISITKTKAPKPKKDELVLALLAELKSLRAERDLYMGYLAVLMSNTSATKYKSKKQ